MKMIEESKCFLSTVNDQDHTEMHIFKENVEDVCVLPWSVSSPVCMFMNVQPPVLVIVCSKYGKAPHRTLALGIC